MKNFLGALGSGFFLTSVTISGVQASCTSILENEIAARVDYRASFNRDFTTAAAIGIPLSLAFPPAGLALLAVPIGGKIVATFQIKSAKSRLAIYTEAAHGGGDKTKRLFRRLKRKYAESEMNYDDFIRAISEADAEELGCSPGSISTKEHFISVIADSDSSDIKTLN